MVRTTKQELTEMFGKCNNCPKEIEALLLQTSMFRAAADGHKDCLKATIDAGADVNKFDEPTGNRGDILNMVEVWGSGALWTSKYSEVFFRKECVNDPPQKTALIYAVENGKEECLELLLRSGADVNKQDSLGRSALMIAAEKGFDACVDMLIAAGADVNQLQIGTIVEDLACFESDDDWDHVYLNQTALMYAAMNGHVYCLKRLLKARADITLTDTQDMTALKHAEKNGHSECIEVLEKAEAGEEVELDLQDMCREKVRGCVSGAAAHAQDNLFVTVPKLGLPQATQKYILFNHSVDKREGNSEKENQTRMTRSQYKRQEEEKKTVSDRLKERKRKSAASPEAQRKRRSAAAPEALSPSKQSKKQ